MDSLARICHQSRSEKLYFELQYLKKSRKKIFYSLLNVLLFIYLDCNYTIKKQYNILFPIIFILNVVLFIYLDCTTLTLILTTRAAFFFLLSFTTGHILIQILSMIDRTFFVQKFVYYLHFLYDFWA